MAYATSQNGTLRARGESRRPSSEFQLGSLGEYEDEFELEGEFEDEGEFEFEGEYEDEGESEEFFRQMAARLGQWGQQQRQALRTKGSRQRKVALGAARAALSTGLGGLGGLAGTALGGRRWSGGWLSRRGWLWQW